MSCFQMRSFLGTKDSCHFYPWWKRLCHCKHSNRKRTGFEIMGPGVISSKRGSVLVVSCFVTKHPKTMTVYYILWFCGLAELSWVAILLHIVLIDLTFRIYNLISIFIEWVQQLRATNYERVYEGNLSLLFLPLLPSPLSPLSPFPSLPPSFLPSFHSSSHSYSLIVQEA